MSRIRKAYETRFRWMLQQVGTRRLEQGVEWLVEKARRLGSREQISLAEALGRVEQNLATKLPLSPDPPGAGIHFCCDAGLGGLTRWLRAAGYEAAWEEGIDDDVLLEKARQTGAVLLTTDSMLMERRVLRDRIIPSLWLPPVLGIEDQLRLVFREFGLTIRQPRCMACGGELVRTDKESLRDRIPPRTYKWLDEYFVCARCGKLFWHGTHWLRIENRLGQLRAGHRGAN
jgi:uncharacterized protein with PIN domain